jgi:hypothetical protein
MRAFAGVAQSVEQLIRNEKVGGSIPLSGTKQTKAPLCKQRGFFVGWWTGVVGHIQAIGLTEIL